MRSAIAVRSSKYDLRRESALDAAAATFAQLGYHGASTSLIADRLGIRQGSLYYYFSSKEQALEEVCLKGVGDLLVGLIDISKSTGDADTKIRAAILNHLRAVVDRPDYVRTFIHQRQFLPDASRRNVGRQVRLYEKTMIGLLEQGIAENLFRRDLDCEVAALGLIGECNAVFTWYGRRAKNRTIDGIADSVATRFSTGVQS